MKNKRFAALAATVALVCLVGGCAVTADVYADLTGARTPVVAGFEGDCRLVRGGGEESVAQEMKLEEGDTLFTGSGAYLALDLGNDQRLFLEPSTRITIDSLSTASDKDTAITVTQGKLWAWVRETLRWERYLYIHAEDFAFEAADALFSVEPQKDALIVDCVTGEIPVYQGKGSYLDILAAGIRYGFYPIHEYSGGVGWEWAALDGPGGGHPALASYIPVPADLAARPGGGVVWDTPAAGQDGPLAEALAAMARLESVESAAITETSMEMAGISVTSTIVTRTSEFYSPFRRKMVMEMNTAGTVTQAEGYTVQNGTEFVTWFNSGSGWQSSSATFPGINDFYAADSHHSAIVYLGGGASLNIAGHEEVNGVRCIRIDGVITGDALAHAMGSVSATADLGEAGAAAGSIGEIPVSYWLDEENHWLVRMEMDMTQAMNELIGHMGGVEGMKITAAREVIEYFNFNNAAEFTLPG